MATLLRTLCFSATAYATTTAALADVPVVELSLGSAHVTLQPQEIPPPPPALTEPSASAPATLQDHTGPVRFGTTGSRWIGIGAGVASNGEFSDMNLYGRYEWFIAKDVELIGELGLWNYDQAGKDSTGINTSFVVRYHWFNNGTWTFYVDGGIGLLFSTDPVNRSGQDEGSSFNFTPRFGGGLTRAIGDEGARLEVGLRWAHVSNARIAGNNDNPGRDSLMLYAGVILPF